MKTLLYTIIVTILCLSNSFALVGSLKIKDKCHKSDLIVRGVVIDIINLAKPVKDSGGYDNYNVDKDYSGPKAVALVRVVNVLKGETEQLNSVIFIPCGYDFNESPCELTKTKEYILFLEEMGRNYYHPLGPFCMHRVSMEKVGLSGFDFEKDFDPHYKLAETLPLQEFIQQIKVAIKKQG